MCIIDLPARSVWLGGGGGGGKRKVDGSTATSGKNECAQRSEEQRLSHYGDIKHTSGTHIILWAIKMPGGWDRGGVATLNVAQQQREKEEIEEWRGRERGKQRNKASYAGRD